MQHTRVAFLVAQLAEELVGDGRKDAGHVDGCVGDVGYLGDRQTGMRKSGFMLRTSPTSAF